MNALKFEWHEGPHGVTHLAIIGDEGTLMFTPDPALGEDTLEKPFDRTAALTAVTSLAKALLGRLSTGHPVHRT